MPFSDRKAAAGHREMLGPSVFFFYEALLCFCDNISRLDCRMDCLCMETEMTTSSNLVLEISHRDLCLLSNTMGLNGALNVISRLINSTTNSTRGEICVFDFGVNCPFNVCVCVHKAPV